MEVGELLNVAPFGLGVDGQVTKPLLLRPAARHRKIAVGIAGGNDARQNPARPVQASFDEWRGFLAEALLKFAPPYLRRRVGVVADTAEDLEKMPVKCEHVV